MQEKSLKKWEFELPGYSNFQFRVLQIQGLITLNIRNKMVINYCGSALWKKKIEK